MTSYSEEELINPSIKIINRFPSGISTSNLINQLRYIMQPTNEDLEILSNRNDDKFSQKVRNLRSHKTLERTGYVKILGGKFYITDLGKKFINQSLSEIYGETIENTLTMSVDELDLSFRSTKCIQEIGIRYIGDLVKISEDELLAHRNLGIKSLNEIKSRLEEISLKLPISGEISSKIENKEFLSLDPNRHFVLFLKIYASDVTGRLLSLAKQKKIEYIYQLIPFLNKNNKESNVGKKSIDNFKSFLQKFDLKFSEVSYLLNQFDLNSYYSDNQKIIDKNIHNYLLGGKNHFIDTFISQELENFIDIKYKNQKNSVELKERYRTIINHRFGINKKVFLSLEDTARFYNITRERVRQLQKYFTEYLLNKGILIIFLERLYNELKKIKFKRIDHLNTYLVKDFFKDKIDSNSLKQLIKTILSKEILIEKFNYDENKEYFFIDQNTYLGVRKMMQYIKLRVTETKYEKKEQYKKITKVEEKFGTFFDSRDSILNQIKHIKEVIYDKYSNSISIHKDDHFITGVVGKLKLIIDDKFKLTDLLLQINRSYRFNIPSLEILKKHLALSNFPIDSDYIYFDQIPENFHAFKSKRHSKTAITDIEKTAMRLIFDDDDEIFIYEKFWEVRYDYKINTSSVQIYLHHSPLFKTIAKNIFTLAGNQFSKYEINDAVLKRKKYLDKYKNKIKTSWDGEIFNLEFIAESHHIATNRLFINDSVAEVLNDQTYIYIKDSNYKIHLSHKVLWHEKFGNYLFENLKIITGDKVQFQFNIEKYIFNVTVNQ
ncbi:MAG: DNA-directed RNA polymerase subunit alpha C-terminal domain-containing protein [Candidatus Pelagibacterales bacterium]